MFIDDSEDFVPIVVPFKITAQEVNYIVFNGDMLYGS